MTMTPKVFAETAVLVYLVTGEAKAAAVKAAFADEPEPGHAGERDPRPDDGRDPRRRSRVAALELVLNQHKRSSGARNG